MSAKPSQETAPQYSCPNCGCTKARDYGNDGPRECSGCGRDATPDRKNYRAILDPSKIIPESVDAPVHHPERHLPEALPDGHNY